MKFKTIESGLFKLDGGAMFGVVPKTIWQGINPADDDNLCTWSMRCLLVETDDRKILFDTGMGDKQDAKFKSHFHPHGPDSLLSSLQQANVSPEEITDVFITHLHFDHTGGAISMDEDGRLIPTFPNARYISNKAHWEWARTPNPRERASFLKENFIPLEEEGLIDWLPSKDKLTAWTDEVDVLMVDGHTEKMMIPLIKYKEKTLVFCADLMPSSGHLGLPYVMSYDIRPLETIVEKQDFLSRAVEEEFILFLEHDPVHECITVTKNNKGRFVVKESGRLTDFIQ